MASMNSKTDKLEQYVVRLAKILFLLGILLLPLIIASRFPTYETSFELPEFIKSCFYIYYVSAGIAGFLLSVIVYPFGFFVPACVYLARYFQPTAQFTNHLGFVAFVLLFFAGIIFMMFNTPYNLV